MPFTKDEICRTHKHMKSIQPPSDQRNAKRPWGDPILLPLDCGPLRSVIILSGGDSGEQQGLCTLLGVAGSKVGPTTLENISIVMTQKCHS